jgi:hypothetical protein
MRRMIVVLAVCAVLPVVASADLSVTVAAPGVTMTSVAGAVVDTFDDSRPGWAYDGSFSITMGSDDYKAAPAGDTDNKYFCVPEYTGGSTPVGGTASVTFSSAQNYLGLYWGSIDTYNTLTLYLGGSDDEDVVGVVTGTQILAVSGGSSGARDNSRYVNVTGVWFDRVKFASTSRAFELDNLAVVPVPGAVLLGFLGLGAAGLKLRKHA